MGICSPLSAYVQVLWRICLWLSPSRSTELSKSCSPIPRLPVRQRFPYIIRGEDLLHRALHVQAVGIVAGVALVRHGVHLPLDHVLVVVQVAVVRRHTVIIAHVLAAEALLAGHEGFVELLAVARADDVRARVAEQFLHRLRQIADGRGVRLLDEQVARIGVLEGEHHQIHCFIQIHEEAGHVGIGDGDGIARLDLVDEQRNHRAARAHDVAVARASDDRAAALCRHAGVGVDHALHHGLGDAHGVDGIGRLVRGQADHALYPRVDGRVEDVVRADDVRAHGLHGEELAGRHLLERRGVKDVVHTRHGVSHRLRIAHVADVELDLLGVLRMLRLQLVAHVVLLLLVTGEDADLPEIGVKKVLEDGGTEGTGAAGDH